MLSRPFLRHSRRRAAVCALAAVSLAFFYSSDISLADERDDAVANQNEAERKQQEVISSLEESAPTWAGVHLTAECPELLDCSRDGADQCRDDPV